MADSERMVALKKAYAEIILNTAREAASRVMESEKKASRAEQDLCRTKDEGLRLLVRLKQMLDAKTIESEIKSSNQKSKIDVLEAQLQEAESVILDLREELKWARDKLEKARNNQFQPENEDKDLSWKNATTEPSILPPDLGHQTRSETNEGLLDQINFAGKCWGTTEQAEKSSVSHCVNYSSAHTGLASMNTRNKDVLFCGNGSRNRLCAPEEKPLSVKLSPSDYQHSLRSNSMIASTSDERKCTISSTTSREAEKNLSGEELRKHVNLCSARERNSRELYQPPSILSRCRKYSKDSDSHSKPFLKADNVDVKRSSNELDQTLRDKSSGIINDMMSAHKEKKPRTEQIGNALSPSFTAPGQHARICQPFSLLNRCKTYSFLLHGSVKSNEEQTKINGNQVKLKPLTRLDPGLTLIKGGADPIADVMSSAEALNSCNSEQNPAETGMELPDKVEKQELDAKANSTTPCCTSNNEVESMELVSSSSKDVKVSDETMVSEETMVNVPLVYSDLEYIKASTKPIVAPSEADNNDSLKYTFNRKRKKEALSSIDQNIILEESRAKRKTEGKRNDSSKALKSCLIKESSRDSRRLAQVARQLVSLSGKRWQ
ncbi:hypothetical protein Tsubulata_036978 [Turnera subulata]|uniref:Uncharacterized protein n=1 Tax=Turnera subulata TaxID=218843 RepID=A0A9Q0JDC0_9ROSI|nr:hypothetical protein Tsubulata_036978 [Turnera subulata]